MLNEREPELFDVLVTLLQATNKQCKFPLWQDHGFGDMGVCGKQTLIGQPYCHFHCQKAYVDFGKPKK